MKKSLLIIALLVINLDLLGQQLIPDLSKISDTTKWENFDREVSFDSTLTFKGKASEGPVWLKDYSLSNGKIEVDIRGKNLQGQSFVGVAFHVIDHINFEAIYFRPFNFFSPNRSTHAIQYIAMPDYPWQKLREQFPDKYESKIHNPPNPDGWFHVTIELTYPQIKVFVNNEKEASLIVEQKNTQKNGSVGLWVGYMSDGKFKNLKITKF